MKAQDSEAPLRETIEQLRAYIRRREKSGRWGEARAKMEERIKAMEVEIGGLQRERAEAKALIQDLSKTLRDRSAKSW